MMANHAAVASGPKPAPYRQVVAEATIADDPLCALHPATMKKLSISDGDVVLLKSKRRRETYCIAVQEAEGAERKLKINETVRSNLRVCLGDAVFVYACRDAKYGGRGRFLRPTNGITGVLTRRLFQFQAYLKPYNEHLMCSIFIFLISIYSYSFSL